jgi:transposase
VDETGRIVEQRNLRNEPETLRAYFAAQPADARLVVEATGHWMWLYELLEDRYPDLVLAHPLKTKAIASARIKTDKLDSTVLAQLLRADLIPTAYIPPRAVRDTREVLRYRAAKDPGRQERRCRLTSFFIGDPNSCTNSCSSPASKDRQHHQEGTAEGKRALRGKER